MILRKRKMKKLDRQHLKESFNARLIMEKKAQIELAARLTAIELNLKNIGRI